MQNIIKIFLLVLYINQNCYSQKDIEWDKVKKIELYSFEKNPDCEKITSKNVDQSIKFMINADILIDDVKTLKKYKLDVLIESKCLVLRLFFPKYHDDYILYLDQGLIFKLKNGNDYFIFKDTKEMKKVVTKLLSKKNL